MTINGREWVHVGHVTPLRMTSMRELAARYGLTNGRDYYHTIRGKWAYCLYIAASLAADIREREHPACCR